MQTSAHSRIPRGSRCWVFAGRTARIGRSVVGFVGAVGLGPSVEPGVVSGAEEPAVLHVGGSAAAPGDVVMDVAHRRWPIAARFGAALVPDPDRGPLGLGVEPAGAAQVEDLGGA